MKRRTLLTGIVTLAVSALSIVQNAAAQSNRLFNHPSGFSFLVPQGWTAEIGTDAVQIVPPGSTRSDMSERYRILSQPLAFAADDPRFGAALDQMFEQLPGFRKLAASQGYETARGQTGLVSVWALSGPNVGQGAQMRVYATHVNGVAAVILAAGSSEQLAARNAEIAEVALSVGPAMAKRKAEGPSAPSQASHEASPIAQFWLQRMTGKLLTQMSSYNSGGGSGSMSSKTVIHLQSDGTFQAQSLSSVTINVPGANATSGGGNRAAGTWRIFTHGSQAVLEIRYESGQIESNLLQADGEQTLINGKRWFVTQP